MSTNCNKDWSIENLEAKFDLEKAQTRFTYTRNNLDNVSVKIWYSPIPNEEPYIVIDDDRIKDDGSAASSGEQQDWILEPALFTSYPIRLQLIKGIDIKCEATAIVE